MGRAHLHLSFAASSALLFAACAAPTNASWATRDPPLDRSPAQILRDANPREPIDGLLRPNVIGSFDVDYEQIAVAPPLVATRAPMKLDVTRIKNDCRVRMGGPAVTTAHCVIGDRSRSNSLGWFPPAAWRDERLEYVLSDALVDFGTGLATAKATATVSARALVPGVLYAFRKCTRGCAAKAEEPREEELVLVGPPVRWVTATVDPDEAVDPHSDAVTMLSLAVRRGGSAAAHLTVEWRALLWFSGLHPSSGSKWARGNAPNDTLTFSVDVAWLEGADAPSLVGFVTTTPRLPPRPRKAPLPGQGRAIEVDGAQEDIEDDL